MKFLFNGSSHCPLHECIVWQVNDIKCKALVMRCIVILPTFRGVPEMILFSSLHMGGGI
jgi:hypothetical protein